MAGLAGCIGFGGDGELSYEVWVLDQGTDTIQVLPGPYDPEEGGFGDSQSIDLSGEIDAGQNGQITPHSIEFTSDFEYAVIATVTAGRVALIRTEDYSVVDTVETGTGTVHAGVHPDDEVVHADVPTEKTLQEITLDTGSESLSTNRSLHSPDDETFNQADWPEGMPPTTGRPVDHDYTHDGKSAYVAFGWTFQDSGLAKLNLETMEYSTVLTNFGTQETLQGSTKMATHGTISDPKREHFFAYGGFGPEQRCPYFMLDSTKDQIYVPRSGSFRLYSKGRHLSGSAIAPEQNDLWLVHRLSNDAIAVNTLRVQWDASTGKFPIGPAEPGDDLTAQADKPGEVAASPEGEYMFCTLRGPNPVTQPQYSVGENPGVAILDRENRERVDLVQPADNPQQSDPHGIAVRTL